MGAHAVKKEVGQILVERFITLTVSGRLVKKFK